MSSNQTHFHLYSKNVLNQIFGSRSSSSSSSRFLNCAKNFVLLLWLVAIILINQQKYVKAHRHRGRIDKGNGPGHQDEKWNITDWWENNIYDDVKYDFFGQNNSQIDSMIRTNLAPMSRFVKLKPEKKFRYNFIEDEMEVSESRRHDQVTEKSSNKKKERKRSSSIFLMPLPFGALKQRHINLEKQQIQRKQDQNNDRKQSSSTSSSIQEPIVPKSSLTSIKTMFYDYFTNVRTNLFDRTSFVKLKRNLRQKFVDYGLQTAIQTFYNLKRNDKGHNIVGIYPGRFRNTKNDSILVIGAHYDTVPRSPGVEDNGSGSVAVLEIARLLYQHKCQLNTTIILVLFDMEEDGLIGSKFFVRNYLYPIEIERNEVPVKGALIIDMLLEYDNTINSQSVSGVGNALPEWTEKVRQNRYRADFTAVWARRNIDSILYQSLEANWLNQQKYKLFVMDVPLPKHGRQLTSGLASKKLKPYQTFLRSDHSSFWYPHSIKNITINAVLLTDLGPWRKKSSDKYHSSADNSKLLNRANLLFLKNAIDSIMRTVLDLSDGYCQETTD